jgi:hypothetical protein
VESVDGSRNVLRVDVGSVVAIGAPVERSAATSVGKGSVWRGIGIQPAAPSWSTVG